jgi:hypothetical protein
MRAKSLAAAAGFSGLLLCALASASSAQEKARQRAPFIRIDSENGAGVVSSYVRPTIHVSEDAYVFAVMMDLDGRIQVLHPDFPGISVRVQSRNQLRLPNFFAGFNDQRYGSRYGFASYNGYGGVVDTRGTVIALASRAPFNLELIEADGDWDMVEIRQLIEGRLPAAAAQLLARYLGAKGEPIGRDFMRFAGQRQNYYASNAYMGCTSYAAGYGYRGGSFFGGFARYEELRALGLRPVFMGYDQCGMPVIVAAPFARGSGFRPPPVRPPGDTTIFPKSHFPQGVARRPPPPQGVFPPPPERSEVPQLGDVTIRAPRGGRADPRDVLDQYRPQSGFTPLPERPAPPVPIRSRTEDRIERLRLVNRPDPRVADPSQPVRAPERVREPSQPVRAPERIREPAPAPAPAPVAHERPSPPASPPQRAETHSKPQPVVTPPPRQ